MDTGTLPMPFPLPVRTMHLLQLLAPWSASTSELMEIAGRFVWLSVFSWHARGRWKSLVSKLMYVAYTQPKFFSNLDNDTQKLLSFNRAFNVHLTGGKYGFDGQVSNLLNLVTHNMVSAAS